MQHTSRNYEEAISQQYLCIMSQIGTCTKDTNNYSQKSLHMNHFCGFVDVTKTANPDLVWHIQVHPNIIVHFLNFSLFHNYWYCDYEYLMVKSKNQKSTFCGNRFPWVYDTFASSVKIIFFTQRFDSKHYWVEVQYYGAHRLNYQHFVEFVEPLAVSNKHFFNNEENSFETFHFISYNILGIMYLSSVNVCSKLQVVCYDGPGIKSPVLPVTYNQSEWTCQSSTFQMVCMITRLDPECPQVPSVSYQAKISSTDDFYNINRTDVKQYLVELKVNKADNTGTSRYRYNIREYYYAFMLIIRTMNVGGPFMLFEGFGCMYGGLYIVNVFENTVTWSHCSKSTESTDFRHVLTIDSSLVLIHYGGYSGNIIHFLAYYEINLHLMYRLPSTTIEGDTATIPVRPAQRKLLMVQSFMMNLRHVRHINIKVKMGNTQKLSVEFTVFGGSKSCVYCTVFFAPRPSNITGRNYDVQICKKISSRRDHIQSVFINISMCDTFTSLSWTVLFSAATDIHLRADVPLKGWNQTDYQFLPVFILKVHHLSRQAERHPAWFLVYMKKTQEIPHYAIWKVWMEVHRTVTQVLFEVFNNSTSSAVYQWYHHRVSDLYMAIDKAVNLLFKTENITSGYIATFTVWFIRHFIYEDSINEFVPKQMPDLSYITFHKHR